ncbi:MAG: heme ABC transporter permease CcmB [Bacteroidetes bacterium QS_8_68_28]|jgi:heme exporter protein B|nr:MAG: heme ABC transporter permease CcmB [Bacteroidetes bacterium QS_8_68_28]
MNWLAGAWAVFKKDLRLELRSRYALSTLLLFVLAVTLVVLFGIGDAPLTGEVETTLLWVVVLFAAALGLGRAFVYEEEQGTVLLLRLHTRPSMVYAGKLLFNTLLVGALTLVTAGAFWLMLGLEVGAPGLLLAVLALGALGLAGATTLLGALLARAGTGGGALLTVLLFPLLTPLLVSVVSASQKALAGVAFAAAREELLTLVGFAGVTITASVLLFDYVWEE